MNINLWVLGSVKKTYNLKFKEHVGHALKFFAMDGVVEPGF
ncbi:hypothetical protein [Wolbachia endosymbiont of Mansonella perstans]|nr:hypothetical protein [Wolbachia endosymbiont of Mansonella perstans]